MFFDRLAGLLLALATLPLLVNKYFLPPKNVSRNGELFETNAAINYGRRSDKGSPKPGWIKCTP